MPIKRLMRATQDGWSELAVEHGSFAAPVQSTKKRQATKTPIGRALPGGKHEPHPIDPCKGIDQGPLQRGARQEGTCRKGSGSF